MTSSHKFRFGDFEADILDDSLRLNGEKLRINRRTFGVLRLLIERPGEIISKQEFFETVWADTAVVDNSLTVAMTALRKLLNDNAKDPRFIESLPRKGYRFIAEVRAAEPAVTADQDASKALPSPRPRPQSRMVYLAFAVIAAAALTFGFRYISGKRSAAAAKPIDSVAVLPFENSEPENAYLADGLADALIDDLAKQPELRVINRDSAFRYRDDKLSDLMTVGRDLGVRAVVTGRIKKGGDGSSLDVELTDVENSQVLWTKHFDNISDTANVRAEICGALARRLGVATGERENQPIDSKHDSEAYRLYLKGRYYWNQRTPDGYQKAVDLYNQAIYKDPEFAPAYAGLADSYAMGGAFKSRDDQHATVRAAALKAIALDPQNSNAYASLGLDDCFFKLDFASAEQNYRKAVELNPNDATAHHWLAELLVSLGRVDEGFAEYDRAIELDPLSMPIRADKGIAYFYARNLNGAVSYLEGLRQIDPTFSRTYDYLAFAYRMKGRFQESIAMLKYSFQLKGNSPNETKIASDLEQGFNRGGPTGYWQAMLRDDTADKADIYMAYDYAQLGEIDKAFLSLENALAKRDGLILYLKARPELDPLHKDPRWTEFLRRAQLE